MQLLFLRCPTLASAAICSVTWSRWSHVVLVNPRGAVIEASATHGVRLTTVDRVLVGASSYRYANVNTDDQRVWDFAKEQIGKPYDWTAILGVWTHRDWQEDDSWFCSELVAAALLAGGTTMLRKRVNRITPGDLYTSPLLFVTGLGGS